MTLQSNKCTHMEAEFPEKGFTILEVLVALVIFSLTSIALFQSLSSYFAVSERVTKTSESMIETMLSRRTLSTIVENLVPIWDQNLSSLDGNSTSFSSQAIEAPSENLLPITPFEIQLEKTENSTELIYISENLKLPFYLKLTGNPVFEYQSNEGVWWSSWPQDNDDIPGVLANDLPQAIRLKDGNNDVVFIILIPGRHRDLPEQLGFFR